MCTGCQKGQAVGHMFGYHADGLDLFSALCVQYVVLHLHSSQVVFCSTAIFLKRSMPEQY